MPRTSQGLIERNKMFNTNQIVKAKFGQFIVLGYRIVAGETLVQVKPYNPTTGKAGRGEMAFPESALQAI
jgi:hypothetical protein